MTISRPTRRRSSTTGASRSDDVLIHALPVYHTHGLFVATHCVLLAGASMVFLPKFDAAKFSTP